MDYQYTHVKTRLDTFVRLHDIDVPLTQEVTHSLTDGLQGYTNHHNTRMKPQPNP